MTETEDNEDEGPDAGAREIADKARRKEEALRRRKKNPLFGLAMFGLVGWAVAVPTVLGIALGVWLDARTGSDVSWTLTFLFVGVVLGCLNAWYWVQKESRDD